VEPSLLFCPQKTGAPRCSGRTPRGAASRTAGPPRGANFYLPATVSRHFQQREKGLSDFNIKGSFRTAKDIIFPKLGLNAKGCLFVESEFAPPGTPGPASQLLRLKALPFQASIPSSDVIWFCISRETKLWWLSLSLT
jgi:hypothetical protein